MFGFRIMGAPEPNPGWQPLGVYENESRMHGRRRRDVQAREYTAFR
jgi:hypothetical protein